MPFIGNQPANAFTSFAKQDFTTSATTSYSLDYPVANANELALFINFVRQEPTTAYSASGTTLTLTSATSATDDMYCVFLGKALQTVNPADGSVGTSQLVDGAVTGVKASGINTPSFSVYKSSAQSIPNATITKVTFDTEDFDTDSAFASSKFTVPAGKAGKYLFYTKLQSDSTSGETVNVYFYKNGSSFVKHRQSIHASNRRTFQATAILDLVATDYVEVFKDQDGGSARNIDGDANRISYFSGYKLS